jgi:cephalosporin hydroxylase
MVRACLPAALVEHYGAAKLVRRASKLSGLAVRAASSEERWAAICGFDEFRPYQKQSELLTFLERVTPLQAGAICEIGAASGGTLCALCHAATDSAIVISVDVDFTEARLKALPRLGRPGQTVACVAGDSHQPAVYSHVSSLLGGRLLDLLFIDGDHSYSGVKTDFEMYRRLVRAGGLIGFHDIVPDFRTRFGTPTFADSGGVPTFWQELKRQYRDTQEIVESADQDGYGIGLLTCPG